jgi:hypothetical protein
MVGSYQTRELAKRQAGGAMRWRTTSEAMYG